MQRSKERADEIVYGIHPVTEILKTKSRKIYSIYTTNPTPAGFPKIKELLPGHIELCFVERDALTRIVATPDHQGVVAVAQPYQFRKKMFEKVRESQIVLLDNIQDPRNLGAIIRSAVCAGFHGIILPVRQTVGVSATVHKAASGLAERIAIIQVPTTAAGLELAVQAGYNLYLATIDGASVMSTEVQKPLCLVIGNEGDGIAKRHHPRGEQISLPQSASDISYNASVAAGILMFLIAKGQK